MRPQAPRCPFALKALLLGLFTAQVLATIHVYLSNTDLYETVKAADDAGYLIVPNHRIIESLHQFGPAFYGGLFFSLSIGAGLSLLSLAAVWIWDRLLFRKRSLLILLIIPWMASLFLVNQRGFNPMVSSYFLLLPFVVFLAALRWMPVRTGQQIWLNRMVHVGPIILLALLWGSQTDRSLFLNLRDNLLLSNPLGIRISDFYYRYTLYAAEVFKSLNQKTLKTCKLEGFHEKSVVRSLKNRLLHHDYLPLGASVAVDLKITKEGEVLAFENRGGIILRATPKEFLSGSGTILKEFSSKSDRDAFFRRFTLLSILLGFPIALYVFFYTLFRLLLSCFLSTRTSSMIASGLCLLIGVGLLVPVFQSKRMLIEAKDVAEALQSRRWQTRVAALKTIQHQRIEVGDFQAYQLLLQSPYIPERYWLVRALGVSQKAKTYRDLLDFLDDPHPNVVCMAFYALGQRGDKRAVKEMTKRLETSDDWYSQWYGYRALRTLGWKQTKSNSER